MVSTLIFTSLFAIVLNQRPGVTPERASMPWGNDGPMTMQSITFNKTSPFYSDELVTVAATTHDTDEAKYLDNCAEFVSPGQWRTLSVSMAVEGQLYGAWIQFNRESVNGAVNTHGKVLRMPVYAGPGERILYMQFEIYDPGFVLTQDTSLCGGTFLAGTNMTKDTNVTVLVERTIKPGVRP